MTGRKLFIGGLGRTTTPDAVQRRLGRYAQVSAVEIVTHPSTGMSLGFGFVTFATQRDAAHALREADGTGVDGHEIQLVAAASRMATR
ncbi:MAG: RNA recognition motif-containing protein [Myxococcota bacterium]|jgi:RNA recognition motif-containing protein